MESDLKTGDRVRVCVDHPSYGARWQRDDIGILKEVRDNGDVCMVKDGADYYQVLAYNEVERISPPQFIHHGQEGDTPELIAAELERQQLILPTDKEARKAIPITTGVLDYFPAAIAEIAKVSKAGNDQHHPGEPLHWERGKSTDHADTISRHLLERGTLDTDGMRHSAKVAWRALALLQEELEIEGAPVSRGSR